MAETPKGIHVIGVDVENVHRLKVAHVRLLPGGGLVKVTGRNGAGKTSLLRAIRSALGGAGEVLPAAIKEDSEEGTGHVRIQLSNGFSVARSFTPANPKGYLKVIGPDGGEHKQGRLNEWLGEHHDFDVLAFFDLDPARQREILLGLSSEPGLSEKLDNVRARHAELYSERTPHIAEQRRARAVPKPEGERPEPTDVSGEMARLRELQAAERDRQDAFRHVQRVNHELDGALTKEAVARDRVKKLEEDLRAARVALQDRQNERKLAESAVKAAAEEAEAMPDPADEIEAVQERISRADRVHAALRPWQAWDEAQASLEEETDTIARITAAMEELRAEERRLLAESGMPVDGLSFDPESGEPLLNGRPLAVASGAERIRMAVSVAVAANPELRVCLVDEANDLDLDALEELKRLGEEHDFQVWACRIGLEGPGEVLIEDGEARSEGVEEAVAEAAS